MTVQTETELKKCNNCGFCTDDLYELQKHISGEKCKAVSVQTEEHELKEGKFPRRELSHDWSETFRIRKDLMTHRYAT